MKNLELEAEKANQHLEQTLMPKETVESLEVEEKASEGSSDSETDPNASLEEKKDK
jgi:hypothetical protein